jgi:HK97 family phage major capsid protein
MLDDKLKQIADEITSVKKDAQSAWQKFDEKRAELAKADVDVSDTESPAFKEAEEVHKTYAEKADRLAVLEGQRERLWAMMADGKGAPSLNGNGDAKADKQVVERVKDGLASRWDLGAKALASEEYAQLKQKGILNDGSRIQIGTVALAKQADAHEAKALVVEGSPQSVNSATDAGTFIRPERVGYYPLLERPLLLTDLITVGTTQSNAVEYVTQTAFTNNAAFTAESTATATPGSPSAATGVKQESALTFAVKQAVVRTLAHWIPATRQALSDAGQLQTIIEEQLRYGLNYVVDSQIVSGGGTGQDLTGIVSTSGIGTQALGTDTRPDAIHKAITAVRLQYAEPTAVALHPTDWESLRLQKDSTGQYLYGPPAMAGTQQVWGKPVVTGAQFAQGTGIVADWKQAILWIRDGIQVLASDSHSDFFIRNMVAILAELRCAFGIVRPSTFVKVTGL